MLTWGRFEQGWWEAGRLPAGAAMVIVAPHFRRDDRRLAYADSFSPEVWLEGRSPDDWPLIPFSGGQAECAGRNLVLLITTALLASLLER